ncbi:MAG: hypothetical protein HY689_08820 [Chloroflexi bacterium]|nr:hypothetical protein [Chloroflexota bacterium]
MIPLTVIIGVGGQGAAIALGMKQRLLDYASERDEPEAEREYVERSVRIFAIDTRFEQDLHAAFPAGTTWVLQPGSVDHTIRTLLAPGARDSFFRTWWPSHAQVVGDFVEGAGGMRLKGRLAYYLAGQGVAETIAHAVTNLRDVRAAAVGVQTVANTPVYIIMVGSVSGGTGSGIIPTLALHLRQRLAGNVRIIGAIPLASVMALAPAKFLRQNVWANCAAALRELEWWLVSPSLRPRAITPFFHVGTGAERDEITGDDYPFDPCYLFTRSNRNGQALTQHRDYTQLIADCLALDINSPIADQGQGMLSNFLQYANVKVRPPDTRACKPVVFASAGAASLEYPVRSITRYLGLQLLGRVLDEYFLSPEDLGNHAATWAVAHRLEERGTHHHLHDDLKQPVTDARTGTVTRIGPRPGIPGLDAAGRRNVRQVITAARKQFDDHWIRALLDLAGQNRPRLLEHHRTAIWQELLALLAVGDGDGFERAVQFARALKDVLEVNRDDVDRELNQAETGRRAVLARLEEAIKDKPTTAPVKGAIQELEDAWGFIPLPPRISSAKQQFVARWWNRYTEHREHIALGEAVIALYNDLIAWLDGAVTLLNQVETELKQQREEVRKAALTQLGTRRTQGMILEERVLDDPLLVDALFKGRLEQAAQRGSQTAIDLALRMLHGGVSIVTLISDLMASRPPTPERTAARIREAIAGVIAQAEEAAGAVFQGEVARLSIWDALEQEALLRRDLGQSDEFLRQLAPGGAGDLPASDLCLRYITARVQHCVATAVPFWYLDSAREHDYRGMFETRRDGLISYSARPFQARVEGSPGDLRARIQQAVQEIAERAGLSNSPGNASPHRVIVATRELGAPLFLLDRSEREELLRNERLWAAQNGHAYVDQRYVGTLPDDFEFGSMQTLSADHREAQLLLLGFHFGYLRYGITRTGKPNRSLVQIQAGGHPEQPRWRKFASGIAEALARMQTNTKETQAIEAAISEAWASVPAAQHRDHLHRARSWVVSELEDLPNGTDLSHPRRAALELMVEAVDQALQAEA